MPTVLISGDATVAKEALALVPDISAVEVKRSVGNFAAKSVHPDEACERIASAAKKALSQRHTFTPVTSGTVDIEVDRQRPAMTELAQLIPGVELRSASTVGAKVDDIATAVDLLDVIVALAAPRGTH